MYGRPRSTDGRAPDGSASRSGSTPPTPGDDWRDDAVFEATLAWHHALLATGLPQRAVRERFWRPVEGEEIFLEDVALAYLLEHHGLFVNYYPTGDGAPGQEIETAGVTVNMNDVFGWAMADSEPIEDENDLKALMEAVIAYPTYGTFIWASRKGGYRPQPPVVAGDEGQGGVARGHGRAAAERCRALRRRRMKKAEKRRQDRRLAQSMFDAASVAIDKIGPHVGLGNTARLPATLTVYVLRRKDYRDMQTRAKLLMAVLGRGLLRVKVRRGWEK